MPSAVKEAKKKKSFGEKEKVNPRRAVLLSKHCGVGSPRGNP